MKHLNPQIDLSALLRPESIMDNPFPAFHRLREQGPLYWDEAMKGGFTTSYAACKAILHSPHFFTNVDPTRLLDIPENVVAPFGHALNTFYQALFFQDIPAHPRLRTLFTGVFTHSNIETMRPYMQLLATRLLDMSIKQERMEVLREFAYPFVGEIVTEMFGIPQKDRKLISKWACDIELLLVERPSPLQLSKQRLQELAELIKYLKQQSEQRYRGSQGDVFQQIVDACQQEKKLTEAELLGNVVFLLSASIAITAQLIGRTFNVLLNHPEQYQFVQDNPLAIKAVVEEMLRYDGPVVHLLRFAKEDCEVYGREIKAGQHVTMCVSAANRDPAQFSSPDSFDICREKGQHLAFGYGAHSCLGAYFSRTMAEIALDAMLHRLSHPKVVALEREPLRAMRYLKTLVITFEQKSA